jgi:hypothetical protein
MPCSEKRARQMLEKGKATYFWKLGIFCIRLNFEPSGRHMQPIVVGIDPGSKKEGFTVKSKAHTLLNIQADAVTWVKDAVETRRNMRRSRRQRKTPCRPIRKNRSRGGLAPSTRARWGLKLRILDQLSRILPITDVVVEDIRAETREGQRKWNSSFSPLEVGKNWFYDQIESRGFSLTTQPGYETAILRFMYGLKKTGKKLSDVFDAHCVDSWVLAQNVVGGHSKPENKRMLCIVPLRLHRRQLHALQPSAGGLRRPYGSTRSLGIQRGSIVKHPKYGVVYLGGFLKDRLSLHSLTDGKRLTQTAKPSDLKILGYNAFRTYNPKDSLLPSLKGGVSACEE